MINEIDKIYPEEGLHNHQHPDPNQALQSQQADSIPRVVLLPQLGIHGEGPAYRGLTFPSGFASGGSIEEKEKRNH
jgi:hypothetical protein